MKSNKRRRGDGRVFQTSYKDKRTGEIKKSSRWRYECWHRGKPFRSGETFATRPEAEVALKRKSAEFTLGMARADTRQITFEDLERLIEQDYLVKRQHLPTLRVAWKRLRSYFAGMKAHEITAARMATFRTLLTQDGYLVASINRSSAALKRSFRLAHEQGLVDAVPFIEILPENNVRKGFFERDDFMKIRKHLAKPLQSLFGVAYITGWRTQSELLTRKWQHVDWNNRRLRIDPGEPKNDDGREFPFIDDLESILRSQRQRADEIERQTGKSVTHLFFHDDGTPIRDYGDAWTEAVEASCVNRIVHDFRRTAVRNLEMAAVPRAAAMKMVGHKTESIYRRYAIADERLLRDAAAKLNDFYSRQPSILCNDDTQR